MFNISDISIIDLVVGGWIVIHLFIGFFNKLLLTIIQFIGLIVATYFVISRHKEFSKIFSSIITNESIRYSLTYIILIIIFYIIIKLVKIYSNSIISKKDFNLGSSILSSIITGFSGMIIVYNFYILMLLYWPSLIKHIVGTVSFKYLSLIYGLFS